MRKSVVGLLTLLLLVTSCHASTRSGVTFPNAWRFSSGGKAAFGEHFMIASNQRLASDAGNEIIRAGGNAVDAAVAVGFALAVTFPGAGNIG
ncbi:MAG: gamma-glutamyltransferase, partial [Gemmatimonadaceae bacterium]